MHSQRRSGDSSAFADGKSILGIIHTIDLGVDEINGGVDAWIREFVATSNKHAIVLGLMSPNSNTQPTYASDSVSFLALGKLNSNPRVPDVLPLIVGLFRFRRIIPSRVLVHRLELVPIIRMLKPRSKVALFIHTDLGSEKKFDNGKKWQYSGLFLSFVLAISIRLSSTVVIYSQVEYERQLRKGHRALLGQASFDDTVFGLSRRLSGRRGILWVGRFEPVKDPELAIRAFLASAASEASELWMVGEGALRERCQELVVELGAEKKVFFEPPMSPPMLAETMSRFEALIHVSHYEGAPRVLVEGLAQGLKLVVTAGANPEHLETVAPKCVFVASGRTVEAVAAALDQSLKSRKPGDCLASIQSRAASLLNSALVRNLEIEFENAVL